VRYQNEAHKSPPSFKHTLILSLLDIDVSENAIAPIVGHDGKLKRKGRIQEKAEG
jgi:hypothetical protein